MKYIEEFRDGALARTDRALDAALQGPRQDRADEQTLARAWDAIEREGFGEPAARRRWRTWAPRLAAAVLLALGTSWAALSMGGGEMRRPDQPIRVVLVEESSMTL